MPLFRFSGPTPNGHFRPKTASKSTCVGGCVGFRLELLSTVSQDVPCCFHFPSRGDALRTALANAMPKVLTVGRGSPTIAPQPPPAEAASQDDLVALAARVAAGTATERDRARFRELAAGV
jgi:hypothetical protein